MQLLPKSIEEGAKEYIAGFNILYGLSKDILTSWDEWFYDEINSSYPLFKKRFSQLCSINNDFTKWLFEKNSVQSNYFESLYDELVGDLDYQSQPIVWSLENPIDRKQDIRLRLIQIVAVGICQKYLTERTYLKTPNTKMVSAANRLLSELYAMSPIYKDYLKHETDFVSKIANSEACIMISHQEGVPPKLKKALVYTVVYEFSCLFDYQNGCRVKNKITDQFANILMLNIDDRQLRRWFPTKVAFPRMEGDKRYPSLKIDEDHLESLRADVIKYNKKGVYSETEFDYAIKTLKELQSGQYISKIPSNCPDIEVENPNPYVLVKRK